MCFSLSVPVYFIIGHDLLLQPLSCDHEGKAKRLSGKVSPSLDLITFTIELFLALYDSSLLIC